MQDRSRFDAKFQFTSSGSRTAPWRACVVLASVIGGVSACGGGPKAGHEAEYWGNELNTASEMPKREVALSHLSELKDPKGLPALYQALQQKGAAVELRPKVVELIGLVGDASSVQPLLDAIDWNAGAGRDKESRFAAMTNERISKALGKIAKDGDEKAIEALKRLATNNNEEVQLAAVFALGNLKAKSAVDDLVQVADGHPNNFMVKNAVEALSKIGDPKAARVFAKLLFFERNGVSFYPTASYALFLLGKDAMPVLDQVYAGKLKEIEELHVEPNVQKTKALVVYGDIALPEAYKKIIENVDVQGNDTATALLRIEAQRAAGRIGLKEVVPALVKRMDNIDISQSEHALAALTQMGRKDVAGQLYEMSTSAGFISQCKKQGGSEEACKVSEAQIRKPRLLAYSRLSDDVAKMDKLIADEKNEELKKWIGEQKERVVVAAACKSDVACWTGKLKDTNPRVRERAAYALAWALSDDKGGDAAREALAGALTDEDNETRYAAIIGLGRRLPKDNLAAADKVAKQLESEKGKTQYVRINEDLKRLEVRLRRGY